MPAVIPGSRKGGGSWGGRGCGRSSTAWREARESGSQWGLRPGTNWPPPAPAPRSGPAAPASGCSPTQARGSETRYQPETYLQRETRSTRSRHLPLLPARRRPRLSEGGVTRRPSSAWAGPSQDKLSCREFPGHPSSLWAVLPRHCGFRWAGLWALLFPVGGAVAAPGSCGARPGI